MTFDPHNLVSHTVQRVRGHWETRRCAVGSVPSSWSAYLDWNWYHRWPAGERSGGRCLNCGKTLAQVRFFVREVYEPPAGSEAHLERALESGD